MKECKQCGCNMSGSDLEPVELPVCGSCYGHNPKSYYIEIVPGLFLGTFHVEKFSKEELEMDCIISLDYREEEPLDPKHVYLMPTPEGWFLPVKGPELLFPKENNKILNCVRRKIKLERLYGDKLVIHCNGGFDRSAFLIALELIDDGMTANEAMELIREKRALIALDSFTKPDDSRCEACRRPEFIAAIREYENDKVPTK